MTAADGVQHEMPNTDFAVPARVRIRSTQPLAYILSGLAILMVLTACADGDTAPTQPPPADATPATQSLPQSTDAASDPEPTNNTDPGPAQSEGCWDATLEPGQYCGQLTGTLRDDAPEVTAVRTTAPEEQGPLLAACLTDAGFAVEFDRRTGSYQFTVRSEAQTLDYERQVHICQQTYPVDERFLEPLTTRQEEILYDWFVTEMTPCVRQSGYPVADPPSKATWTASGRVTGRWHPFDEVAPTLTEEQLFALYDDCPGPPGDLLYGDG